MKPISDNDQTIPDAVPNSRKRFLAALGLFLAWVAFLITLGMMTAYGPERRNANVEQEKSGP